jgi:hypothetical protein
MVDCLKATVESEKKRKNFQLSQIGPSGGPPKTNHRKADKSFISKRSFLSVFLKRLFDLSVFPFRGLDDLYVLAQRVAAASHTTNSVVSKDLPPQLEVSEGTDMVPQRNRKC